MGMQNRPTKTVYLLLSRPGTCVSRLLHLVTRGEYTHASIGLEGPAGAFYSFARKYPWLPLPGGLIQERVDGGFFSCHPHTPCCLYALTVPEDAYRYLCRRIREMYEHKERYHYNVLGAAASCLKLPLVRQDRKFCSEFVAEMLCESGAAELDRRPSFFQPMDLCRLEGLRPIYRGEVGGLTGDMA